MLRCSTSGLQRDTGRDLKGGRSVGLLVRGRIPFALVPLCCVNDEEIHGLEVEVGSITNRIPVGWG